MELNMLEVLEENELNYRGTGRTTLMISSLPDDGMCVVVVARQSMVVAMRRLIKYIRGEKYPADNIEIIAATTPKDIEYKLRGLNREKIYLDNSTVYEFTKDIIKKLERNNTSTKT